MKTRIVIQSAIILIEGKIGAIMLEAGAIPNKVRKLHHEDTNSQREEQQENAIAGEPPGMIRYASCWGALAFQFGGEGLGAYVPAVVGRSRASALLRIFLFLLADGLVGDVKRTLGTL